MHNPHAETPTRVLDQQIWSPPLPGVRARRPSPFEHVLVATDFSGAAARAIERGSRVPIAHRGRLTILHVLPDDASLSCPDAPERALDALAGMRSRACERLAALSRGDVAVSTALRRGLAHVEIVRGARQAGADLLVLGRHCSQGWADLLVGSIADRVIQVGDLPVLIVNGRARRGYRRPVLAVELTDASLPLITLALSVLDASVSDATLLHVYGEPRDGASQQVCDEVEPFDAAMYQRQLADRLALLQRSARAHGVKWRAALVRGVPRRAILDEAERRRADLITVGTHGHTGLARALLGSVASDVLRSATCDVLVGKPLRVAFDIT